MARASGGCAQAPRLRRPAARLFPAAVLFLVWLFPGLLHAHGVQEARYSPPIPGWLFLVGGGLAVALSFVLVSLRAGGPEDA
ncbi:MAG: hypothetical protein ACE5IM_05445, partial [Nitrospinota bacterium]